jgi:hypothetical protein
MKIKQAEVLTEKTGNGDRHETLGILITELCPYHHVFLFPLTTN